MSEEKINETNSENAGEIKFDGEKDYASEQGGQTDNNLNDRIKELEIQVSEWQDKYLRKVAEFENYKRRTENDQLNLIKYAAEHFIVKLLNVVDDFERSLTHIKDSKEISTLEEGIKLVYNKLMKTLEEQGVKKIEAVGKPFDVHFHEAVMQMQNDSVPPHTVLDEIQCGYIYKDKVIRYSKVIVSDESGETAEE